MSIIQVLVGFGLAAILGLVLAEMNTNSSKQMGQMRLQFERAAVIQSLQSAISNAQICEKFLDTNRTFGPIVTDNLPFNGASTIKANWFYMGTNQQQPIIEGQKIANLSLKVDWIRAVNPVQVNMTMPGTEKVYAADLQIKLSPITVSANDSKIDLKSMTVGKVYFVTTAPMPGGKVKSCYGDAAGSYLCPSQDDIQVMSSGSWVCSSLKKAMGTVCGSGQLIQSAGNGNNATCVQVYSTNAACASGGSASLSATCMTDSCGATSTQSGAATTYAVSNVSIYVPPLDVNGGGSWGGGNVVTDVSCSTSGGSSGTGSMPGSPGSTSCSPTKVYFPPVGANHNTTAGRTITGGQGTVSVPSSTTTIKYKDCNGNCTANASAKCNNTPR